MCAHISVLVGRTRSVCQRSLLPAAQWELSGRTSAAAPLPKETEAGSKVQKVEGQRAKVPNNPTVAGSEQEVSSSVDVFRCTPAGKEQTVCQQQNQWSNYKTQSVFFWSRSADELFGVSFRIEKKPKVSFLRQSLRGFCSSLSPQINPNAQNNPNVRELCCWTVTEPAPTSEAATLCTTVLQLSCTADRCLRTETEELIGPK